MTTPKSLIQAYRHTVCCGALAMQPRDAGLSGAPFASVPPRRSYSLDAGGDSGFAVLFGGCARDKTVIYGDTWIGRAGSAGGAPVWRYVVVPHDARTPPARYGHASCVVPDDAPNKDLAGCLVIHGGRGQGGEMLADMWCFDPRNDKWTELVAPGSAPDTTPLARCYHTLTYCGASGLALYGGATDKSPRGTKHIWLWRNGNWTALRVDRTSAQKRFKHTCWYHPTKNLLFVYGGVCGHSWRADVWFVCKLNIRLVCVCECMC